MVFTDKQQRVVAAALTLLSLSFMVAVALALMWLLSIFLSTFSNVIMPLVVAAILALVMLPYYRWVYVHIGRHAIVAVTLVYLSLIIPLGLFVWFFGSLLFEQLAGLVVQAGVLAQEGWARLMTHWPELMELARKHALDDKAKDVLENRMDLITGGALTLLQGVLSAGLNLFSAVAGLLGWVVFPIYLGFFLAFRSHAPMNWEATYLPFLKTGTRQDVAYLVREFVQILVSFFRGQLVIALLQGILFAIGFSLVGLQYGFVLGLLLGLLNIVPYLGSIVGLGIALPIAFFQMDGGWSVLAMTLLVFTVVQMVESYVLTPRIMGDRTGLHPIMIMVAIFFWGTAFGGIWGMILAIPLTAFLVVFWRLIREKYMTECL